MARIATGAPRCLGVTVWGLTDAHIWHGGGAPVLFDGDYGRKPADLGVRAAFLECAAAPGPEPRIIGT